MSYEGRRGRGVVAAVVVAAALTGCSGSSDEADRADVSTTEFCHAYTTLPGHGPLGRQIVAWTVRLAGVDRPDDMPQLASTGMALAVATPGTTGPVRQDRDNAAALSAFRDYATDRCGPPAVSLTVEVS